MRPSTGFRLEAERLAGGLPPLMLAAERVAETVVQGLHGRRRVGSGEAFWQFRPYMAGDRPQSIDWRTSAKSDQVFVREMEWAAAATAYLWRDASSSMDWRSDRSLPSKRDRAELLLLALASLLLRGGERVALLAPGERPRLGRHALAGLAERLIHDHADEEAAPRAAAAGALPPGLPLARFAKVVLIGDFLSPLEEVEASLRPIAGRGVGGQLVMLLDPAETALPFEGRVRFEGMEGEGSWLAPRVESLRADYRRRMAEHTAGLADIARGLGWRFQQHLTDQPASQALLSLYMALAPAPSGTTAATGGPGGRFVAA